MEGNLAPSGSYTVVLEACDIYDNCDEARGTVDIPFVAIIIPPTSMPMPTLEKTEATQWYNTPTAVPSYTTTPTEQILPILPATGGDDSGDNNIPTGSDQPLLPLAAAALGTSVLLATSSKREEREAQAVARLEDMQKISIEDQAANLAAREASVAAQTITTVNEETPYVEVTSLAALAGVVKETFTGVWEDAIRISAADAPITIVTHNWVNGVDPEKRLQEIAENDAFIEWYYQNVYLPNREKEEQKAAKEAERLAAEQWLADHTAATEEAIRLAKEKEEAETEAAKKAAAQNAKLTKMEAQTSSSNVITPNQTAPASKTQAKVVADDGNKIINKNISSTPSYSDQMKAFHSGEDSSIRSYEEQQEKAERLSAALLSTLNKKMTRDEESTEDKNVFQMSYSDMMKKFYTKEGNDYSQYLQDIREKADTAFREKFIRDEGIILAGSIKKPEKDNFAGSTQKPQEGLDKAPPMVEDNLEFLYTQFKYLYEYKTHPLVFAKVVFGDAPDYRGIYIANHYSEKIEYYAARSDLVTPEMLYIAVAIQSEFNWTDLCQEIMPGESEAFGIGGVKQETIDMMIDNTEAYKAARRYYFHLANGITPNPRDPDIALQALIIRMEEELVKLESSENEYTDLDKYIVAFQAQNGSFNADDIEPFYNNVGSETNIQWDAYYWYLAEEIASKNIDPFSVAGISQIRSQGASFVTQFMTQRASVDLQYINDKDIFSIPENLNLNELNRIANTDIQSIEGNNE